MKYLVRQERVDTDVYLVEAETEAEAMDKAFNGEHLERTSKTQEAKKVEVYTSLVVPASAS